MTPNACIVDTNVVVSGLVGTDSDSPPARILEAMLDGAVLYLMSDDLLTEYSSVLRRPSLVRRHELTDGEIDRLLSDLVANALWCEPAARVDAPDTDDSHLWALLASSPQARLVTGDRLLLDHPPNRASVISPRRFVDAFLSLKET